MKPRRLKQIERQILKVLDQSWPCLLDEYLVLYWLLITLRPRVLRSEMEEALERLALARKIHRLRRDEEAKAGLTDEGKAALPE